MPLLGPAIKTRNDVFQLLKPSCVALQQAAVALNGPNGNMKVVAESLESVKRDLSFIIANSTFLDGPLADYVFLALSNVFRASQRASIRSLELSLQCVAIIVDQGWRSQINPQMAAQIVILCTLMGEKKPQGLASSETTDELQASAFWCLHHIFTAIAPASEAKKLLVAEANIPNLGQTIKTILDGIEEGDSADVQIAGVSALRALMENVATREIHAAFLPGTVSKLTKVLTLQTQRRRLHTVLVGALEVLKYLLQSTLNDEIAKKVSVERADTTSLQNGSVPVDAKWVEMASSQLKPALAIIFNLRDHSRPEVKEALAQLCFMILKHCKATLENCASICIETLVLLAAADSVESIKFRLEALVSIDSTTSALLQNTLYDWLRSLPTRMQAADEQSKIQRMRQISTAYGALISTSANTTMIDRTLANVLRDSVVITLQMPRSKQQPVATISPVQSLDITLLDSQRGSTQYSSALARYRGQEEVLDAVQDLAKVVSTSISSTTYSADLARALRQSHGDEQVANFWLLLNATETALEDHSNVDDFLVLDGGSTTKYTEYLEDIFAFSLDILTDTSDVPVDQRLQALALQTMALRARTTGQDFRYELIDALYPVLHTLATPDESLQQDSIATLNIFTASCGYSSVKDLIVENVDYLTNAVALKLNAFDVSPQAPQVLLMMVRLAGPALLPYLEDTIDSIFAALEDYHGYPLLVELLFRVLSVVAEEGSKAPQLAITDGVRKDLQRVQRDRWQPASISQLSEQLAEQARNRTMSVEVPRAQLEAHPQRPWGELDEEEAQDSEASDEDHEISDDAQRPIDVPDPPPPAPKTYNLLLKISELTQHFLPSASASLRTSLLMLIKTTTPAIARHENSFLPLINTLWPEIVSRLDDQEPHVVATALDIISSLCEYAGDFMRTRVQQLWPALLEMHTATVKHIVHVARPATSKQPHRHGSTALVPSNSQLKQALTRMRVAPADYSDTSTRLVWTALVHLFTIVVRHVPLQPQQFDEVLDVLEPVLDEDEVCDALEAENPDAVWLVTARRDNTFAPMEPPISKLVSGRFAAVPG